jgi:RND superfamily putative drug exporter
LVDTIRSIIPANAHIPGDAGFDADRSAAVEGIDGTLLTITSVLVLVLLPAVDDPH